MMEYWNNGFCMNSFYIIPNIPLFQYSNIPIFQSRQKSLKLLTAVKNSLIITTQ
jgi:hypothetical protein